MLKQRTELVTFAFIIRIVIGCEQANVLAIVSFQCSVHLYTCVGNILSHFNLTRFKPYRNPKRMFKKSFNLIVHSG